MTLIYGHRGARAEAPENTLPSFRKALEAGVTRVELDLHLSADQQLVVIHDPTLKRTTGLRGKVAQHTAAELSRIDARFGLPGWKTPCAIPTLAQLLQQCPEIEHYQLEVKSGSERQSRIVLDAIATLTHAVVASVQKALSHCPTAPRQLLVCGGGRKNGQVMGGLAGLTDCGVQGVEAVGVNGDMLEAQAFAFLAVRAARGLPISAPGTTGVLVPVCGGRVAKPDRSSANLDAGISRGL